MNSSAIKPITAVSTSTAAFIGMVPPVIHIPFENRSYDPTDASGKAAASSYITKPIPASDRTQSKSNEGKACSDCDPNHQPLATMEDKDNLGRPFAETIGVPVLCTNFGDFKRSFGDFSTDGLDVAPGGDLPTDGSGMQNQLAHAVYGFFNNGGTRCYVIRFENAAELRNPESLLPLEAIDEISIVAAPGIVDPIVQNNIITQCENLADRVAILDGPVLKDEDQRTKENILKVKRTDYATLYYPWIRVFDVTTKSMKPDSDGKILCAPSGHIAGIYARVDHQRGVHKAPANEVIRGAVGLLDRISKSVQDELSRQGINCIRNINKEIRVLGARTMGGDADCDFKYINVRRTLIFLRESIDQGTQWVAFERKDDRMLWAKITRNVTAFLTTVWRDGALFGTTPQEAFYVKCDEETNSLEERKLGRVTTEIGVALSKPAEFVMFRIAHCENAAA